MNDLIALCDNSLCSNDDDWLKAGMELGLIRNAVIFGVREPISLSERFQDYSDNRGNNHFIAILGNLLSALEYQGYLSDACKGNKLREVLH